MCLQATPHRLADNRQDLELRIACNIMAESVQLAPAEHMCYWCVMLLLTRIRQAGGLRIVWQIMSRTVADKNHVHPCILIWSISAKEACAVLCALSCCCVM